MKMVIVSLCLVAVSGIGCTVTEAVPEPTPAPIEGPSVEKNPEVPAVEGDVPSVAEDAPAEEAPEIAQAVETVQPPEVVAAPEEIVFHPALPDSDQIYAGIARQCTLPSLEASVLCLNAHLEVENNRLAGAASFETGRGTEEGWSRQGQQGAGIILDIDGDGVETRDDIEFQTGFLVEDGEDPIRFMEWVGDDDGLLVLDRNGDGSIQHEDLFINGFDDLRSLDEDGSGLVEGREASALRIWKDCNANRLLDRGESVTLPEAGIDAIRTDEGSVRATGDEVIQHLGSYRSTVAVLIEAELERLQELGGE